MNRDNLSRLPAPSVILSGDLCGPRNAAQESAWPHCPANLEVAEVVCKIEKSVLELDTRHILTHIDRFCGLSTRSHVHALPRSKPERGHGALSGAKRKAFNGLTKVIFDERFEVAA